jgi:hypothetical protein
MVSDARARDRCVAFLARVSEPINRKYRTMSPARWWPGFGDDVHSDRKARIQSCSSDHFKDRKVRTC